MRMFQRLNASGMTVIMVTHSAECSGYAGRVMQLSDGLLKTDQRTAAFALRRAS
jgi:putative ABC transport system ATP-binding protein